MRVCLSAIVALVVASATPVSAEPSPDQVRRAMRDAMGSSYQRELPGDLEPGKQVAQDRSKMRRPMPRPRRAAHRESGTSAIASWLLWALVVVAGVVIALFLARELAGYTGSGSLDDTDADDGSDDAGVHDAVIKRPLGDAEELAARGRFGEAIHALLLRTLAELSRKASAHIPESLTSREILGRVALPPEARVALEGLVLAVEITHFGGAEPGESEYSMCRDHFRRFASAYTRGMAA